jgi:radical SAM superfamily enzyme YgiQ (UPF0313 family)
MVHRPPPEIGSLIIRATDGCPYNKCAFCGTYKNDKFRIRKTEEIKADLERAKKTKIPIRKIFLAEGNSIVMKTDELLEIVHFAYETFPNLEGVSTNASAKFVLKKERDELKRLRDAGLTRVYMGVETGDDELLMEMNKGITTEQTIKSSEMIKNAGIELSQTVIIGLGGRGRSVRHVESTAMLLNEIDPDQIRLHTLILIPGTPLYERLFEELSKEEALIEMRELIDRLCVNSQLIAHRSNYLIFKGDLPADKDHLLSMIDLALSGDRMYNSQLMQYEIARSFYEMRMRRNVNE